MNLVHAAPASRCLVLSAVLALGAGLTGCSKPIDMAALDKNVREGLSSQMALESGPLSCPDAPKVAKAGDTFTCTTVPTVGGKVTVQVTEKDDAGSFSWNLVGVEGIIELAKIEAAVAPDFSAAIGEESKIDCGAKYRGLKAGDSFDCVAKGATVDSTVTIHIQDAAGAFEWTSPDVDPAAGEEAEAEPAQ